jgi:hypothetical protein
MQQSVSRVLLSVRILVAGLAVAVLGWAVAGRLPAAPINPASFKERFETAAKDAEVVGEVRVLAAACTATVGGGADPVTVTLEVSLQMLAPEKGPVKKGEVIVVWHQVPLPAGPGPRSYGYMAAVRQFPFTPGVKGSVALNYDKDHRRYIAMGGWVPEPNGAQIPSEVGKVFTAGDAAKSE